MGLLDSDTMFPSLPVTATYLNTHTLTMLLHRLQGQGPFLPLPTQPQ